MEGHSADSLGQSVASANDVVPIDWNGAVNMSLPKKLRNNEHNSVDYERIHT